MDLRKLLKNLLDSNFINFSVGIEPLNLLVDFGEDSAPVGGKLKFIFGLSGALLVDLKIFNAGFLFGELDCCSCFSLIVNNLTLLHNLD